MQSWLYIWVFQSTVRLSHGIYYMIHDIPEDTLIYRYVGYFYMLYRNINVSLCMESLMIYSLERLCFYRISTLFDNLYSSRFIFLVVSLIGQMKHANFKHQISRKNVNYRRLRYFVYKSHFIFILLENIKQANWFFFNAVSTNIQHNHYSWLRNIRLCRVFGNSKFFYK